MGAAFEGLEDPWGVNAVGGGCKPGEEGLCRLCSKVARKRKKDSSQ